MSGAAVTQKLSQNQKSKKKSKKWKENGSKESKYMGFKWIWFCEINQNKSNGNQKLSKCLVVGNFMFCKAVKNDCFKLYFKIDKLSKKDYFKRFERVFAGNLSIQTRLQRYKVKKIQEFKITKFQGYKDAGILF